MAKLKLTFFFSDNARFGCFMFAALFLLLAQMYLNTGTISGYAVTLKNPTVLEGGYLANYDYSHYQCNYHFIMGDPPEQWYAGWVLRRQLFFILGWPLFKLFGFYMGGVVTALVLSLISFYFFIGFIYRHMGSRQAYVAMALLGTYPGIMYWIGSPFAQIMIVPCCCWLYVMMWQMSKTDQLSKHLFYLLLISMLFTAYDLFVFFYPTILWFYFKKRQFLKIGLSFLIMLVPQVLIILWLRMSGASEVKSDNSGLYLTIIQSYLHPESLAQCWQLISQIPQILWFNFMDSNFWVLPMLFLVLFIWGRIYRFKLNPIESGIFLTALLVFLFNNLAPYYQAEFQMRGEWIARIYQPMFIVLLMYSVRFSAEVFKKGAIQKQIYTILIVVSVTLNAIISVGGCLRSNLTEWCWYRFYQHSPPETMRNNLDHFGIRPIGFPDKNVK